MVDTREATNPTSPPWFRLEQCSAATLLKSGEGRKVWRVRATGGSLIAKVFDRPHRLDGLFHPLALVNPAFRETRAIRRAIDRDVPTARLILTQFDRASGRSVVVTEELLHSQPLWDAWAQADSAARREILDAVSSSIARVHERGFVHRDLHPENLLLRRDSSGSWEVFFVDILGAKCFHASVPFDRAVASLAQLDQSFHRMATPAERDEFLAMYLNGRGLDAEHAAGWAQAVESARRLHAEKLASRRDRRLGGRNKYFGKLRLGAKWRAVVVLELERRHVFPEFEEPDRTLVDWRSALPAIIEGRDDHFDIERIRASGIAESLRWRFGGSPARTAFEQCHRRRHRDEFAELALGFAEHRGRFGGIEECFVIRPWRTG